MSTSMSDRGTREAGVQFDADGSHIREVPRNGEAALIGLSVAFFTLAGCQCDSRPLVILGLLLLWPVVALVVLLRRWVWLAVVYLVAVGVLLRLGILLGLTGVPPAGLASDVLDVTAEALGVLLRGGNPYTHVYASVLPPDRAFVFSYPPGSLLYYLPGWLAGNVRLVEVVSAALVLGGLAWAVRSTKSDWALIAMGLYAAAPPLVTLATDNSNDTSAGAVLFLAALTWLAATRSRRSSTLLVAGILMGWAVTFKMYNVPFWPLCVAFLMRQPWRITVRGGNGKTRSIPAWLLYVIASVGFAATITVPFLLLSPEAFIKSLWTGPANPVHTVGGWNVWGFLEAALHVLPTDNLRALPLISVGLMLSVVAAALWVRISTPSRTLAFGMAAWFALMFFGRWTTYAYFAGIAPVALLIPLADTIAGLKRV